VLVLNKWDLVDEDRRYYLEKELDRLLGFASWAPRVNISAATGRGVKRLMPHLRTVWRNYQRRVPTRELNRFIEEATAQVPPPIQGNKALRVKYVTQAETAPPSFVAFTNGKLPASYRRYLERQLRERYDFTGVPVSIAERPPRDRDAPRGRGRPG
jgi:GTP-binding protein